MQQNPLAWIMFSILQDIARITRSDGPIMACMILTRRLGRMTEVSEAVMKQWSRAEVVAGEPCFLIVTKTMMIVYAAGTTIMFKIQSGI
jgi:hypothetical protein